MGGIFVCCSNMKIGYSTARSDRRDYDRLVSDLRDGLNERIGAEVGCIIYGSYNRGEARYGRSKIDALFTFRGAVTIDKIKLREVSSVVGSALRVSHVPFNPTVTDSATMSDGRFNPFDIRYENYFEKEGEVIAGEDYRPLFRFEDAKGGQYKVREALSLCRRTLLLHDYFAGSSGDHDDILDNASYEAHLNSFDCALDEIARSSERIMSLVGRGMRKSRFSGLVTIPVAFPEVNMNPLKMIKELSDNPEKLDDIYFNPGLLREVLEDGVAFLESLVCNYMLHPEIFEPSSRPTPRIGSHIPIGKPSSRVTAV